MTLRAIHTAAVLVFFAAITSVAGMRGDATDRVHWAELLVFHSVKAVALALLVLGIMAFANAVQRWRGTQPALGPSAFFWAALLCCMFSAAGAPEIRTLL